MFDKDRAYSSISGTSAVQVASRLFSFFPDFQTRETIHRGGHDGRQQPYGRISFSHGYQPDYGNNQADNGRNRDPDPQTLHRVYLPRRKKFTATFIHDPHTEI
jgi:hypothetical protein